MRKIKKLILHCSATPNGKNYDAATIDIWHKERGWKGIGYHHVICINGEVQKGRPEYQIGAHCRGHNHDSIGICMIGTDKFSVEQWDSLRKLVREITDRYDLVVHLRHETRQVFGHYEFSNKVCPGFFMEEAIPFFETGKYIFIKDRMLNPWVGNIGTEMEDDQMELMDA